MHEPADPEVRKDCRKEVKYDGPLLESKTDNSPNHLGHSVLHKVEQL